MPLDQAGLISPVVSKSSLPRCLSFWYHMYGNGVGGLSVLRDNESIYELSKNQGNEWIEARINLEPMASNSRVSSTYCCMNDYV